MFARNIKCIMGVWTGLSLLALLFIGCHTSTVENLEAKRAFEREFPVKMDSTSTFVVVDADLTYMNDDAYALLELLQADRMGYLKLLGVCAAGGNALVAPTAYDECAMLQHFRRADIPVAMGTDVPLGGFKNVDSIYASLETKPYRGGYAYLDRYTDDFAKVGGYLTSTDGYYQVPGNRPVEERAWDFMIRQVNLHPGKVTIIALGGCTNVAKAIQKDTSFANKAAGIVYMGGTFDVPGRALPHLEFNWWYDPMAADICLKAAWRHQLVVPRDAAMTCRKGRDAYELYKQYDQTDISHAVVAHLAPIYENNMAEIPPFCWDQIAVAVFLCPDLVTRREVRQVAVDTAMGISYGCSYSWLIGEGPQDAPTAEVVLQVDRERFWRFCAELYGLR